MQYFLDGYRKGDPRIRPAAEGRGEDQPALPEEVDVLIVGTGPAGLLLAAQLSEFPEIVTRVVERAAGPLEVGRADGVNCRTVETFEAFGLAERMMAEAYWVNETRFWGPDPADPSRLKRFGRVQDVRDGLSEFPHIIVNQARLLDFLLEHMRNSPSRLRVDYGHEAIAVQAPTSDDEPVLVTLRRGDGSEVSVRARYVVGCDGAHSAVRESIGRVAQGYGADKAWGVMDLLAVTDFPDIRLKATIQSGDGGNILLIPREGGYLVRLYVDMGEIAADAWLTKEDVIERAQRVLAPYTLDVREVAWYSVYRVGHRVTDKFDDVDEDKVGTRGPRVFIAGDACHTHTAKAGQGMNVSMQDTYNLGWKLAAVLQGRSPASLLDTYSQERKVIAEDLIAMDTRWSKAIGGAGRVDSHDAKAVQAAFAEVQRRLHGLLVMGVDAARPADRLRPTGVHRDEVLGDDLALLRVGIEQARGATALQDGGEFPPEVVGVLHRHVHPLAGLCGVRVTGVARDEDAGSTGADLLLVDVVELVGDPVADPVDRVPGNLADVQRVGRQHPLGPFDHVFLVQPRVRGDLAHVDVQAHEVPALAGDEQDVATVAGLDRRLEADVREVGHREEVHDPPGLVGAVPLRH